MDAALSIPAWRSSSHDTRVLQMAMLALARADPAVPQPALVPAEPEPAEPESYDPDCIRAGDALSHFVSWLLASDESPHEVWKNLHDAEPTKRRRNPALPGAGFRSPSS